MSNPSFLPIYGTIQSISRNFGDCCQQLVTLMTEEGIINLVVSGETYVIGQIQLSIGMHIAGFFDANAPVPLIYPPQYRALVVGSKNPNETIIINVFDNNLLAIDDSLKLNLSRDTEIVSSNGQPFTCNVSNRVLIVYYDFMTRSIPPQTTPRKIIVMC